MTTVMATKEIPDLLPEIIQKIALFLPLPDVSKCMRVCKQWKKLLSSEQFCKRYLYSHYNLEDEELPSGLLGTWSESTNWACYWAGNDEPDAWVFSDPPRRWKCGIVHLADYDLETHVDLKYKEFLRAVYILCRILKTAEPEELRLDCYAYGNEGVGLIEVCLFPWSKDSLPTADDILSMFNFHPAMHQNPMVKNEIREMVVDSREESADGEQRGHVKWNTLQTSYQADLKKARHFFEWLEKIFSPMTRIGIGCDRMNPIPCFILTHIAPGWVGGILSCATCT